MTTETECWLITNGWGEAGYMEPGREQEQAEECQRLRGTETCPVHSHDEDQQRADDLDARQKGNA